MVCSCNTAGGALRLWPFGLLYLCPAARRGRACNVANDTTKGLHTAKGARRFGRVEALPRVLVSTFRPFRSYDTPLVSTFWRFRTYEKGGRLVFTIRRGEYRYKPAAPAFGRGRGLSTFSISGGRLLLSSAWELPEHTAKPQHGRPWCFAPLLLFTTFAVEIIGILRLQRLFLCFRLLLS